VVALERLDTASLHIAMPNEETAWRVCPPQNNNRLFRLQRQFTAPQSQQAKQIMFEYKQYQTGFESQFILLNDYYETFIIP
jgi:hypothetical protein